MPRLPPPKAMAIHSGPTGGPSSASPGSEFSSSAASLADPYYMPVLESSEDDLGVASYDPTTEGDDDAEEEFTLKSEPQDDDDLLASIKDDYESELSPVDAQVNTPNRRRGRPRKELIPEPVLSKAPKPRSKTGCKTCRKRKKKCDEGRPGCTLRIS